ncbi:selenocysteine-specific translation elongation factor [Clostridium grantii]|uniref:Selenocysteine-specific elongation factor n=1 Tax=Clostridium grantii DSM 8605 TaxID=1121316 RepID=A0A1M5TSY1_9CLOT|nr:selenocysteine-specific translation elongation factor [Clostridium grantii]SHH53523.1 selenocysteine-specific elongation factor [Clostridium grantii DSM 8605]
MKHIIIGTAGHIDHGKTQLIKALTGRETDTLAEEKKRGISINLGFTYFDLPSGKRAGIIDVPGHEKFIKNMLAGAMGIDIVALVVAADEGIMPQTKEHLEILQLLGVKKGIIVITKKDLVDDEWLTMIENDVKEATKDTFLKNAPIIPVSSKNKEGLDNLINFLDKIVDETKEKDKYGHFRLPIDRIFSVSGFGTVVTGTVLSGTIKINDELMIYPSGIKTKVRGIQIHGETAEKAEAAQRCAINLMNVKKEDIQRGDIVSIPNVMEPSYIMDSKLMYLKSVKTALKNRQRVRFYSGSSEIIGRIVLLEKEELKPGESAFVQIKLEKMAALQMGDKFIIRNYSPMYTIGGGTIIDPKAEKAKRFNKTYIDNLKTKGEGSVEEIIGHIIEELSPNFPSKDEITKKIGRNIENIEEVLIELENKARIYKLEQSGKSNYIHVRYFRGLEDDINKILKDYHRKYPLEEGISKEEFKTKIFSKSLKSKLYNEVLQLLVNNEMLEVKGNYISKIGFEITFNEKQIRIKNELLSKIKEGKFSPPKFKAITEGKEDDLEYKKVFELLIKTGELIKISQDIIFSKENYELAKDKIINFIKEHGQITLSHAKEELNTSRQYSMAFLEHLDEVKVTKRDENIRKLI